MLHFLHEISKKENYSSTLTDFAINITVNPCPYILANISSIRFLATQDHPLCFLILKKVNIKERKKCLTSGIIFLTFVTKFEQKIFSTRYFKFDIKIVKN